MLSNLSKGNESTGTDLLAGEKLKRVNVGLQVNQQQESADTLDINGIIQPKSLRAKIDLKEAHFQSNAMVVQELKKGLTSSQD